MTADTTVWFNPDCSKCRTTQGLLADRGIDATYLKYLDNAPSRAELQHVLTLLGTTDPRDIARRGEQLWAELDLDAASDDRILDMLHEHPILIERPIVIIGNRAIIGRPPERVLELIAGRDDR